ncbi:peptidase S41 family protein [Xylogone sp. PMI_703]|nr:peptidase S41 family protein [Xylogone sp. PMI_703]
MPFYPDLATQFIDECMGYLQFHSTIEMLRDPQVNWEPQPIDLIGGLETIRQKATSNVYTSQYDFDREVTDLISSVNDGHLRIGLCSNEVMHFEHGVPLLSISDDGLLLPEIYTLSDIELKLSGMENISPVYLQHVTDYSASYNNLFPSATAALFGRHTSGSRTTQMGLWPGTASYILHFANSTELVVNVTATWPSANGGMTYTDGELLFNATCTGSKHANLSLHPNSFYSLQTYKYPSGGSAAYPEPVLRHPNDLIRGYYLDRRESQDVAILQLPTFETLGISALYAQAVVKFVKQAVGDGKTRMLIDLSNNNGGDIIQGFNLFRLMDLMGQVYSKAVCSTGAGQGPPIDSRNAVTPDQKGKLFLSKANKANMSSAYAHYNFSQVSSEDEPISGYDPFTQPFKAVNIVIITDGFCASTCALFVDRMVSQGVKTIVFGGRPIYSPMQAIGGVKGGQAWRLSLISRYIYDAYELAINASRAGSPGSPLLSPEQLVRFKTIAPPKLENFSIKFNANDYSSINFRNAYRKDDGDIPFQLSFKAADCRRFFTAENYIKPATMWSVAVNAMFNNGSCT